MHDFACVVHLHSIHSDGTGTVRQIARAARRAGADVVLLTDHDTLAARRTGEEGWHGPVLVLVGEEVSPPGRNHYLTFGVDREIRHGGLDPAGICSAVEAAGGFGFAAHPFSRGSMRFSRPGIPWQDLDCEGLRGIEVWSFATDTGERLATIPAMLRFLASPGRILEHPPPENLREWDRLCSTRRVVGIGGLDAHQFGLRVGPVVPLRLMSYRRSFRQIRTHVLTERPLTGELEADRERVYEPLREGRCYIAVDALAPARGFRFWADGAGGELEMGAEASGGEWTLKARLPRPAKVRLIREGREVASAEGREHSWPADKPGAYRVAARLHAHGRERTWILSNPIYLR